MIKFFYWFLRSWFWERKANTCCHCEDYSELLYAFIWTHVISCSGCCHLLSTPLLPASSWGSLPARVRSSLVETTQCIRRPWWLLWVGSAYVLWVALSGYRKGFYSMNGSSEHHSCWIWMRKHVDQNLSTGHLMCKTWWSIAFAFCWNPTAEDKKCLKSSHILAYMIEKQNVLCYSTPPCYCPPYTSSWENDCARE